MKYDAIIIKPEDNVSTALRDLESNRACQVMVGKEVRSMTVKEPQTS